MPDEDRAELLTRARAFLASPQVQPQDSDAKRTFLAEKGLTPGEVDQLLRERPPSVPPRTYPTPPPSNLPNLLIGVARIFTWLTGTSAFVLFVYYRFLLPKLAQSYQARLALQKHQSALITRFSDSVSALKATQQESYKDLPRTVPVYENPKYAQYHTMEDLFTLDEGSVDESSHPGAGIPDVTILRCALEELGHSKMDGISTEELFQYLESKLPWLTGEEGVARQGDLWNQLNTCSSFVSSVLTPNSFSPLLSDRPSQLLWKYVPPSLPHTPPLFTSFTNLQAAFPHSHAISGGPVSTMSARQRTLQVLSDFTGYITTQTYTLGLPLMRGTNGAASGGSPVEDELRREIRAIKGLVLNRRSFLPHGAGAPGLRNADGLPQPSDA